MRLLRTIAVTFAQYSRIPVPVFEWDQEDMVYSMSAFPLVGILIGVLDTGVFMICSRFSVPPAASALLMTAVPVIVTGGFHIDGFMDVSDALSSYADREEKLRILKDPHIGAFAVIRLAVLGLIYIASVIIIAAYGSSVQKLTDPGAIIVMITSAGFVLSRCLSAFSVLTFKAAKNEGMLYYEASSAGKGRKANIACVTVWALAACIFMISMDPAAGIIEILTCLCVFIWYRHLSYSRFGGITGDTSGWLVTVCETAVMAAAAVYIVILQQ